MLSTQSLSFAHGPRILLDEVDFTLEVGERVAVVGHNGAGKSTFLKLLAGQLTPDGGKVHRVRNASVGMLGQEPDLPLEQTILEVARSGLGPLLGAIEEHAALCATAREEDTDAIVALGERIDELGGFDTEHRVEEVLHRLSVNGRHELVGSLSGGERRRVDLARLLIGTPQVLLLDEPTNHLDAGAIRFLAERLRGRMCMFISHDHAFVDDVATRLLEVDDTKLFSHAPPWENYVTNRLIRKEIDSRTAHRKERFMLRELAWLRTGPKARTTKQDARVDRAEALISDVKADVYKRRDRVMKARKKEGRLAKTILEIKDLSLGVAERVFFEHLDLILVGGERWGIVGQNGAGKTTLLRTLLGRVTPLAGEVIVGGKTEIALLDQHRTDIDPDATLGDLLTDGGDQVFAAGEHVHIASYLERFLFEPKDRFREAGTLSGGEKNRLQLARMLRTNANCLFLDEPTNDLDVITLGVLEDILEELSGVALIVSHDRAFLDRVCTGIIAFELLEGAGPGTGTPECEVVISQGNYSHYEAMRGKRAALAGKAASAAPAPVEVQTVAKPAPANARKRSYKEQREYATVEKKIAEVEARSDELNAILVEGSIFAEDPARASAMTVEVGDLAKQIETLYERWQLLEEMRG